MLLWVVFPYMVAAVVAMSLIWQLDITNEGNEKSVKGFKKKLLSYIIWALLLLSSITGLAMVIESGMGNEPAKLLRWLLSMVQFHPDIDMVRNVSLLSRIHFVIAFLFLSFLACSNKLVYLMKPHLYWKRIRTKLVKRHT